MANKYIIHGATYCGDGTASNEAASAGAAGAWNNINVFEGSAPAYGALASGDTVYIRSKTSAGADITRTMTASVTVGSASATEALPISWILDNGAIWSGIDGTLTYTHASTYTFTIRLYNVIKAQTVGRIVLHNTSTSQGAGTTMCINYGIASNFRFDWATKTGGQCYAVSMGDGSITDNPVIDWGAIGGVNTDKNRGLFFALDNGKSTVVSPKITLNGTGPGMPLFGFANSTKGMIYVIGGSISGVGVTTGQPLVHPGGTGRFHSVGLQFSRVIDITNETLFSSASITGTGGFDVIGCDGGAGGAMVREWGSATSRTDSNPPTLQALLPDTLSTAWSWRVYPKFASSVYPMMLQSMKFFTDTAAAKTITQELLVANTIAPNAWNLWLDVEYIDDSTGLSKHLTTRDISGGALAASTANWSATVWGAITLLKKKLSVTTPTSVKQNTPITVTIWSTLASASANDIYFIDPDFGVN